MRALWKKVAGAIALVALSVATTLAADAPSPQPMLAAIAAHPAMWTVHGPKGTAYLFGSIHILPPNMTWQTPPVDAAMKASDVFVFEIPLDAATQNDIAAFIRDNGFLPPSQTLPSLLTPAARKDYAAALALSHVPPQTLVNKRPWLAALVLEVGFMSQHRLSTQAGVDQQVYADAKAMGGKTFRAFETPEEQFRLFMPDSRKLEVEEFDSSLKEILQDHGSAGDLIDAWADGDTKRLAALAKSDIGNNPQVEKALFDDRNKNWVGQIEKMLEEPHTYFITVGAGHLAGPKGLPALLRAKGYKVDGP